MKRVPKQPYRLSPTDVAKIQHIEFGILQRFVEVCRKLNLRYFLHGGTALGAVMYQGFIPWDDDIDVSMPRDDYERFLREGQNYLPDNLRIQSCYNDKEYTLCFAKIRDTSTMLIEHALQNRHEMMNGVYIDIFPIDFVKNRKRNLYVRLLRRRIDMSYWDVEQCPWYKKAAITIMVSPLMLFSPNKATQMLDRYRQRLNKQNQNKTDLVLINRWFYPARYYYPAENKTLVFCGQDLFAMNNPENWLLIDYPRYRTIPKKEEQKPGHSLVFHKF